MSVPDPRPVFRFAPSPNGRLHLGHAYSVLLNADLAARTGGRLLLRIEDIDPTRSRPDLIDAIFSDLAWLGLGVERPVRRQSQHMPAYRAARDRLIGQGLAYPCFCSRGDIRAATAGAVRCDPDGSPLYPGTCRVLDPAIAAERASREPHAWRVNMARALDDAPGPHGYIAVVTEPPARFPPPEAGYRLHTSPKLQEYPTPSFRGAAGEPGPEGPRRRRAIHSRQGGRTWHRRRLWIPGSALQPREDGFGADYTAPVRRCVNAVASAGEGGPRAESGEGSALSGYGAPLSRPSLTRGPPSSASGGGECAPPDPLWKIADPARWGDAVIARRDVPTSYHLAVVVDDAAQGVTHVVRGRDLEAATDLHVLLQALLGLPTPRYHHHALILGPDGGKLAKSKGSESLADLREHGVTATGIRERLGFL